jgi:hypothetical protein
MDTAANVAGLVAFGASIILPASTYIILPLLSPGARINSIQAGLKAVENDLQDLLDRGRAPSVRFIHDMCQALDVCVS